jgi:hypothetical protein
MVENQSSRVESDSVAGEIVNNGLALGNAVYAAFTFERRLDQLKSPSRPMRNVLT